MHPLSRILTSLTIVLAGFLFVPVALALPGAGAGKQMPVSKLVPSLPLTNEQGAIADDATLKELVKQVGFRIRIGYGRYYPRYYGYRRHSYSPYYRYGYKRHYRRYPRYGRYKYSRRYKRYKRYKRRRALRQLRRALRRGYYY